MKPVFILCVLFSGVFATASAQKGDSLLAGLDTAQGAWRVKTYNELFRTFVNSDPVKAIGYAKQALDLAEEVNDDRGKAAALNNIGVSYRNQGALDRALDYYVRSLAIYDTLQNTEGQATTKNNIATIYSLKSDYGQAMRYLEQSYSAFAKMGDQNRIVGSLNNLGILYSDLQLNEQAMKHFTEAYQLSEKLGSPFADPLANIGNLLFRQKNYQRAIEYYSRALEIEKKNDNRLGILNVLTNIGIAFSKAGQHTRAQEYIQQAEEMSHELESFAGMPLILKTKAGNLYEQGKHKEAYLALVKYDSIREKIFGEESTRRIAQLEMAVNLQAKEKEYEVLQREDEIKSLQLRNGRLFIVTVILVLLMLIAGVNVYIMGRRKRVFGNKS